MTEGGRQTPAESGEAGGGDGGASHDLPVWLRLIMLLVAAETLRVSVGLIDPRLVNGFLPWPASPLNGRFVASLYGAVGAALLASQVARSYREVRILVAGILTATALVLLITVSRMLLYPDELPSFPTLWLAFYLLDPLLTAYALVRLGWRAEAGEGRNPYVAAWIVAAAAFGVVGLLSLVAPAVARSIWPWALTEPQSQLYGAFFLAFGVASALAARETDWLTVRLLALLMFFLAALVLLSSFLHLGRFAPGASSVVWFVFFFVQLITSAILLLREELRPAVVRSPL